MSKLKVKIDEDLFLTDEDNDLWKKFLNDISEIAEKIDENTTEEDFIELFTEIGVTQIERAEKDGLVTIFNKTVH